MPNVAFFSRPGHGEASWHGPTEEPKHKNTVALVVRWMKIRISHSNNDLRARNAAPQPQRGGVYERHAGVPCSQRGARRGG